jgi:PleD family two-component response regulator
LSLIIFDIVDFETVKRTLGEGHVREIVAKIEKLMNDSLRRAADVAIRDTKALLILLPDTKKENAFIVLGRLYQLLEEFLARISPDSGIEIHSSVATFPEDARTVDDILNRIYD